MKSNVVVFKKGQNNFDNILVEAEKVAIYNGLNAKETLRLRLITEEMIGILKELVDKFDGEFWVENEDKTFTVNLLVKADSMDSEKKEKLLAVSSTGKNVLAKGFMGKIRSVIEFFAASSGASISEMYGYCINPMDVITLHNSVEYSLWSMDKYKSDVKENVSEWDELEKSIVANLADDVTVGVMGKKIKVAVKKTF